MDSLFNGVRYLSREEETLAMSKAAARRNRSAVHKTLGVKEDEHESLSFLRDVRSLVDEWLALGKVGIPSRSDDGPDMFRPVKTFSISHHQLGMDLNSLSHSHRF